MHAVYENCGMRLDVIIGSGSATQNSGYHRNDVAAYNASPTVSSKPTEELTCGCSRKDIEGKGITPPLVTSEQNAGVGIEGECQTEAWGGYSLRPRSRPRPWPGPRPRLAETQELHTSGNNCQKSEKITRGVPVEPSSEVGKGAAGRYKAFLIRAENTVKVSRRKSAAKPRSPPSSSKRPRRNFLLRKKNKQTEMLEFSASLPSLPESSAARSWGTHPSLEQIDRNHAGLLSGAFKFELSYCKSAKEGSDMSLGSFGRRNHYQGSGSNGFLTKDGIVFGESSMMKPASVLDKSCSKGQSWDLNERASLISYNLLEKNKIPAQREMDFFPFGLKEKSYDQGNPKRSDQRADDIPMDIVELLAKKQYEITGDIERSSNVTRRFSDGEMIGTMKNLTRGYTGQPSFPATDTQLGKRVSMMWMTKEVPVLHRNGFLSQRL